MRATVAIFVLLSFPIFSSGRASADLVVNGGFETGDFSNWNYTSVDNFSFVNLGFAHSGSYSAAFGDLQADGGGSISQSLATTVGSTYTLSFWFSGNGDVPSGFTALVGGNVVFNTVDPAFDPGFTQYSFNFTATSGSTLLEFDAYDNPFYLFLDDVSVNLVSVPEPGSIALLGLGAAGLVVYRRKRRHAA